MFCQLQGYKSPAPQKKEKIVFPLEHLFTVIMIILMICVDNYNIKYIFPCQVKTNSLVVSIFTELDLSCSYVSSKILFIFIYFFRGEKQRMHLRDGFLADQLDPIYVAYNMQILVKEQMSPCTPPLPPTHEWGREKQYILFYRKTKMKNPPQTFEFHFGSIELIYKLNPEFC